MLSGFSKNLNEIWNLNVSAGSYVKTLYLALVLGEIRLIIFFAAKDGEALYSQQKQDCELTVAQIMKSLLPNLDLNWRKWGKPLDHSGMT